MSTNENKLRKNKKRKSDSDGVTVKRSYYSFSKYYPGGGSSQKYRRVMKDTRDEKLYLKILLAVSVVLLSVLIGYILTSSAVNISYAPTTEELQITEEVTVKPQQTEKETTVKNTQVTETTEETTIEEPEREINVTQIESITDAE